MSNALIAALDRVSAVLHAQLDSVVGGRLYTPNSPINPPLPCLVWHSLDDGGRAIRYFAHTQWEGVIAIRVFAASQEAANTLAQQIATTLPGRYPTSTGGGALIILDRPVPRRPADPTTTTWMAAHRYLVRLAGD